tara:strand:+ start:5556 stop:6059 length:504 start_codon:yes stop_codon:yes gene_type:complete
MRNNVFFSLFGITSVVFGVFTLAASYPSGLSYALFAIGAMLMLTGVVFETMNYMQQNFFNKIETLGRNTDDMISDLQRTCNNSLQQTNQTIQRNFESIQHRIAEEVRNIQLQMESWEVSKHNLFDEMDSRLTDLAVEVDTLMDDSDDEGYNPNPPKGSRKCCATKKS